MVIVDVKSVSGIPKFYESRFSKDRLNYEILSPPEFRLIFTFGLELEFQWWWLLFGLECHAIVGAGNFQNFGHILYSEAECERFMADVAGEGFFSELKWDKSNMTWVHGLDGQSFGGDIDVYHLDEVLEGVDDFAEEGTVLESGFEHMAANGIL